MAERTDPYLPADTIPGNDLPDPVQVAQVSAPAMPTPATPQQPLDRFVPPENFRAPDPVPFRVPAVPGRQRAQEAPPPALIPPDQFSKNLAEFNKAIGFEEDPGVNTGRGMTALNALVQGAAQGGGADIPKAVGIVQGHISGADPRDTRAFQMGEQIDKFLESTLPTNPKYRSDLFTFIIPNAIGQGAGTIASFVTGAGFAKIGFSLGARALGSTARLGSTGLKVAGSVASVPANFSSMAVEGFEDAIKHGAKLEDAFSSFYANGALGATEFLPVVRALGRADDASGGVVSRTLARFVKNGKLRQAGEAGIDELIQETIQTIGSNLIASDFVAYDPKRQMFEGVGEAGAAGFTVGTLYGLLFAMLPGRQRGTPSVTPENNGPTPPAAAAPGAPQLPPPGSPPGPSAGPSPTPPGSVPGPNYFDLPPPPTNTEFLRGQIERLTKIDAELKSSDPTYLGDPNIGDTIQFFRYLEKSEQDFERLRSMDPVTAKSAANQLLAQEVQQNRELLELLKDPVRMVSRPTYVLQQAGVGRKPGKVIPIQTDENGDPILKRGGKWVVTAQGDKAVGAGRIVRVDDTRPENLALSPVGQRMVREARERMLAERGRVQEALDAASANARPDTRKANTPASTGQGPALLEKPVQMRPDSAPGPMQSVEDAAMSNAGASQRAARERAQASTEETLRAASASQRPDPSRFVEVDELPDDLKLRMRARAVQLGQELPPVIEKQDLLDAGVDPGRVQSLFARRAAAERIRESAIGEEVSAARRLERAGIPLAGKGQAAILRLMPKGSKQTYRALNNILRDWGKSLGKDIDALTIVDLTAWIKRDPTALKRLNGNGTETAAFLHSFLKRTTTRVENTALAFSQQTPAVFLRDVSHELTHLMLYVRNTSPESLASLWGKLSEDAANNRLDAKTKAIFDDIKSKYDGSPEAVLGEEFLAYSVENLLAGRYTSRADLRASNGETYSWADQLHDLIKSFYNFVRSVFEGVLKRDVIADFLKGIEKSHGIEFLNPMPETVREKPSPEQFDAHFARRVTGTHSPFFSPLVRQIETALEQKSIPLSGFGRDYAGLMENWAKAGLVSKEELAWTRIADDQGVLEHMRAHADERFSAATLLDAIRKNAVSIRASEPFIRSSSGGDPRDGLDFRFSENAEPDADYVREIADEHYLDDEVTYQFDRNHREFDNGVAVLASATKLLPTDLADKIIGSEGESAEQYLDAIDGDHTKETFEQVRDVLQQLARAVNELVAKANDENSDLPADVRRKLLEPIVTSAAYTAPLINGSHVKRLNLVDFGGDRDAFEGAVAAASLTYAAYNSNGARRSDPVAMIEWLGVEAESAASEVDNEIETNMERARDQAYEYAYESEQENADEIHIDRNLGYRIEGNNNSGYWRVFDPNGDEITTDASSYDRAQRIAAEHAAENAESEASGSPDDTGRGPKWGDRLPYRMPVKDYRDTLLIYENDQVEYTSPSVHWSDKDKNIIAFLRHAGVDVMVDGKNYNAEAAFEAQSDAAKGNAHSRAAERRVEEIDAIMSAMTQDARTQLHDLIQSLGIGVSALGRIANAGDILTLHAKINSNNNETGLWDNRISDMLAAPLPSVDLSEALSIARVSPLTAIAKFGHWGYQELVKMADLIAATSSEFNKLIAERERADRFVPEKYDDGVPAMPYIGQEFEKIAATWVPLVARYHLWRAVAEGRDAMLMVSGEASARLWGATTYRHVSISKIGPETRGMITSAYPTRIDRRPIREKIATKQEREFNNAAGQVDFFEINAGFAGERAPRQPTEAEISNALNTKYLVEASGEPAPARSTAHRRVTSLTNLREVLGSDVFDAIKKKIEALGDEPLRLEAGVDIPQSYFTLDEGGKKGYRVIYDRMYPDAIRDIFKKMKWGEPNIRRIEISGGEYAWFMEIPDNVREFFAQRGDQPIPTFGARFARRNSPDMVPDANIEKDPLFDDIAGGPSVRFARRVRDIEFAEPTSAFTEGQEPAVAANVARGKEALKAVIEAAKTQPNVLPRVAKAMYRNLVGWIGFVGNDTSKGIAHIDRMPERKDLLSRLPNLIAEGVVGPYYLTPRLDGRFYSLRRNIVSDGETVVIASTINDKAEPWVLTARPRTENADDAMFNRSAGGIPLTEDQGKSLMALAAAGNRNEFNSLVDTIVRESSNVELFVNQPIFDVKFARRNAEPVPPTYSGLYTAIEKSDRKSAPAGVWQAWLKEATKRGATEAEIKWTGLREWLADRKGEIKRDDVLAFLRKTDVQLGELQLGDDQTRWGLNDYEGEMLEVPGPRVNYRELVFQWNPAMDRGWTVDKNKNGTYSVYGAGINLSGFPSEDAAINAATQAMPYFRSLHWDRVENPIFHARFNDRIDKDGNRVLFIEEFQSDWHNRGRAMGYREPRKVLEERTHAAYRASNVQYDKMMDAVRNSSEYARNLSTRERIDFLEFVLGDPSELNNKDTDAASSPEQIAMVAAYAAIRPMRAEYNRLKDGYEAASRAESEHLNRPSKAPFDGGDADMVGFMLKRLVRYAVDNGFERVGWTPGSVQAKRYNLDMHVGEIVYRDNKDGTYRLSATTPDAVRINLDRLWDQAGIDKNAMTPQNIADVFGPDIRKKIEKSAGKKAGLFAPEGTFILRDLDLKVDDKPKRDLYDGVVPNVAAKIAKAFGSKLVKSTFDTDADQRGRIEWEGGPLTVAAIEINDDMREAALDIGFARFARRGPVPPPAPPTGPGPGQSSWFQNMTAWIGRHDPIFTQTSQRIRAVGGTRAAYELGNEFRRDIHSRVGPTGQKGVIGEDYHGVIQGALGKFVPRLADMLSDMSDGAKLVLADVMRGTYLNPATGRIVIPPNSGLTVQQAQAVRQYLNDVLDFTNAHMQGLGQFGPAKGTAFVTTNDLVGKIANYFPQQWRIDGTFGDEVPALKGESREAAAMEFFKAVGIYSGAGQTAGIREMMNNINGLYGFVSYAASSVGPIGRAYHLADSTLKRVLQIDPTKTYQITVNGRQVDVRLSDFLDNDPSHVLLNYTSSMVRHAEWVRRFGPKGEVIDAYMDKIDRQRKAAGHNALTPDEQNIIVKAIQSNVGGLQRPNQKFDSFQQWVQVVGNGIYLSMSTLASLPELIMPAVRVGMTGQLYAYRAGLRSLFTASGVSKDRQFARELGIIHEDAHIALQNAVVDYGDFRIQKWNQRLFSAIGLNIFTRWTQTMAASAGRFALPGWARLAANGSAKHQRWLREVGLTAQDLSGYDAENYVPGTNPKIDAALRQIASEIVINPTHAAKAQWMNDPRFRLVSHIKSYMWGFNNTVLQRVGRETINGNMMPLIFLIGTIAMAGALAELREWLVWGEEGNPALKKLRETNSPEALWLYTALERGGAFGPASLAVSMMSQTRAGSSGTWTGTLIPAVGMGDNVLKVARGGFMYSATGDTAELRLAADGLTRLVPGAVWTGTSMAFGTNRSDVVNAIAPTKTQQRAATGGGRVGDNPRGVSGR